MNPIHPSPTYNLKAMLQSTGLNADVLRAWERRYDLPRPRRTPGGHRLYSERDLLTVKWLRARQAEGFSISRAVELWKEAVAMGRDPLAGFAPAAAVERPAAGTSLDLLRQDWLEANLAFDSARVDEVLNQAFAIYPLESVCAHVLQRGLSEIGNAWYLDQVSVQQEHFASALAGRRLETLIAAAPRPTRRQTILVGCPAGEQHTFSALLLNLLLRRDGLAVVYLGADVPAEQLAETARAVQADLVVLAAQQLTTAATLQSTARLLQQKGIPAAYGGLIFNRVPALRERIPAVFLGESLDEALRRIQQMVAAPAAFSTAGAEIVDQPAPARLYREKRALVEAELHIELQQGGYDPAQVEAASAFFANGLSAALALGDPAFLEADLDWINRLLTRRQTPAESLIFYLTAYRHSLQKVVGSAGALITDWMGAYLSRKETLWPLKSS